MYFKTKIFISALLLTTLFFTGCGNAQDTEIIPIEIISKFPDLYETYPLEAINDNNNTIGAYNNPMIILVMGQSNIANHGARYDAFDYNATKDVYYFNGYELSSYASPIGANTDLATGRGSTFLPYLGDLLLENTSHDGILFVNIAVGGSTVNEWNTIYRRRINYAKDFINKINSKYTHILWHQGESANFLHLSTKQYKDSFVDLQSYLLTVNISAPIYMARASYAHSVIDDNVINAQNELIQEFENIYAGANTDILGITYRDDDIHLNKYGLEEHAKLWLSYLK